MKKENLTLAIYGVQDIDKQLHPVFVHDHNITLMHQGAIKKYLQLERYTGIKYDHRLPVYLSEVLKTEKLLSDNKLDVIFVDHLLGRSFINEKGNIRFEASFNDSLDPVHEEGRLFWLDHHVPAYVINHELAHVFSNLPFYGPFEENSLHVHFDGGASKSNFSAWIFREGEMKLLEYNWDLKHLSSLFNANALTFSIVGASRKDQNGMPGKFMGYSSYGRYDAEIESWLKQHHFFSTIWNNKKPFFQQLKTDWNIELQSFDLRNEFIQNMAATIQHIFERELIEKLKQLKTQTRSKILYYSGGSALNIKANSRILSAGLFDELFIPPCTNDAGLSLGAAAYLEWKKHGVVERHTPYLNNWGLNKTLTNYEKADMVEVVKLIQAGRVIGICNGYGEAGPRALGNRSIIARADSKAIAKKVSQKLKKREWYRPIAPVMLKRNLSYFTNWKYSDELSQFMLLDFPVLNDRQEELEGCVHVDGSSRIQTIDNKNDNPFLYDLLETLEDETGMRALINTSFNSKGKPIVHSDEDARQEALHLGLDYLVLHGRLIEL